MINTTTKITPIKSPVRLLARNTQVVKHHFIHFCKIDTFKEFEFAVYPDRIVKEWDGISGSIEDVLFVSKNCRDIYKYPGAVIYVDGESNSIININHPRFVYIGMPIPPKTAVGHVQLYHIAHTTLFHKFSANDFLNTRNSTPSQNFLVYIASNCVTYREKTFNAIVELSKLQNLPMPEAQGACYGNHKELHNYKDDKKDRISNVVYKMSSFRFALVMENRNAPGYITEKIANAFMASTIPIYYGTSDIFKLFNRNAFIFYDPSNPKPSLDRITYLEKNKTAYLEMLSLPILHDGSNTLNQYFSLSDYIGNGYLKKKIRIVVNDTIHNNYLKYDPKIIHGTGLYKLDKPTGKIKGSYSWSQVGQDIVVDKILGGLTNGFFVEIGGYDGELHSNTLFFEIKRKWTGLLVEANPYTYKQMVARDRVCSMVHACISKDYSSMTFKIGGGLTTAIKTSSSAQRKRIDNDAKIYGSDKTWEGAMEMAVVNCTTLNFLLQKLNRKNIDYFSLDVEGAEMHILKSIEWDAINIGVLTIEVQENRKEINTFMISHNFVRVEPSPFTFDDVFINEEYIRNLK